MHNPKKTTRRRGTVMTEMVLVMPLIFVILSMLIYFGRGVVRVQHGQVMDRYVAWHQAAHAPGPGDLGQDEQLNRMFFGSNADDLSVEVDGGFPAEAEQLLIAAAEGYSANAAQLLSSQIAQAEGGRRVTVEVEHDSTNTFWSGLDRPMVHRHTRIGHDWAHINGWYIDENGAWQRAAPYGPNVLRVVRDLHLQTLDEQLSALQSELGDGIRNLYLARPTYRGPEVEY